MLRKQFDTNQVYSICVFKPGLSVNVYGGDFYFLVFDVYRHHKYKSRRQQQANADVSTDSVSCLCNQHYLEALNYRI